MRKEWWLASAAAIVVIATVAGVAAYSRSQGEDSPAPTSPVVIVAPPPDGSTPAPSSTSAPPAGTGDSPPATDGSDSTESPDPTGEPSSEVGEGGETVVSGYLTLVDKQHSLPPSYAPTDLTGITGGSLRAEAAGGLEGMLADAYATGYDIQAVSAYRSYGEQESTFAYWVSVLGEEEAERVSARPGHSEHQLGLAVDLSTAEVGWGLVESFGDTAAGQWLADHAHEYGFALSYPAGAEATTGYAYEPWHFRYIGRQAAADWKASGLTLNQYLAG